MEYEHSKLVRHELEQRMKFAAKYPLTLVVAPMGYGKTTVIRTFVNGRKDESVIWISLGQNEVDAEWVWSRICKRFSEVDEKRFGTMPDMSLARTAREMDLLIRYLKERIQKPKFIVLDDYQECKSKTMNHLIRSLATAQIEGLHIILASRTYPELAYEELVLKNQCMILEQNQFVLSRDELYSFFENNEVDLSQQELDAVMHYTDGWISAAYLVLLDYKRTGELRLSTGIQRLLKTGLFDELSEKMRALLLKMSIFDEFSAEEAEYIAEMDSMEYELERLAEVNHFLKLDIGTGRYQMHSLLRGVAKQELKKIGEDQKRLHDRAAVCFAREGETIRALVELVRGGDKKKIFDFLEYSRIYEMIEKVPILIRSFFEEISEEELMTHPKVYLSYIFYQLWDGDSQYGHQLYERAKRKYLEEYTECENFEFTRGELFIIDSFLAFNDLEKVNQLLKQACHFLGKEGSAVFQAGILTYGAPESLVLWHRTPGKLRDEIEREKDYSSYYMRLVKRIEGGWKYIYQSEYELTVGNVKKAAEYAEISLRKAEFRQQRCVTISGYFVLIRCAIYEGDCEKVTYYMNQLKKNTEEENRTPLVMDYEMARGFICALLNRFDEIPGWIRQYNLECCNQIVYSIRGGAMTHGVYLRQKKEWVRLHALTEDMLTPGSFEDARYVYVELYAYLFQTISIKHLEGEEEAIVCLKKAIDLVREDKIVMPFAEQGEELICLLEQMPEDKYACYLIPFIKQYMEGRRKCIKVESDEIDTVLTKREQEVIELVRAGRKNSEIGKELHIANVTVEKTLTSIYRKLDVTNRTAAIAKIEEYNE